jgi:hypothetical protein
VEPVQTRRKKNKHGVFLLIRVSQFAMAALALALALTTVSVSAVGIESPIALRHPNETAGKTFTYASVEDPTALNLDGSIYGIAYCLSPTSKANWSFSADGG